MLVKLRTKRLPTFLVPGSISDEVYFYYAWPAAVGVARHLQADGKIVQLVGAVEMSVQVV